MSAYTDEDRAHFTTELMLWLSDSVVIAALFRAGLADPGDIREWALELRGEVETPGKLADSRLEDLGWRMLRREEVREIIARRVAASAEGVTEDGARRELKRLRDLFRAAIDKRLRREEVVVPA